MLGRAACCCAWSSICLEGSACAGAFWRHPNLRTRIEKTVALTPTKSGPAGAAPSGDDDVFLREVDDAVRQDDAMAFLRRYGMGLLIGIGALIAALAGYLWWDYSRESALEKESEALVTALDYATQADFRTASEKAAPLIADGSPGVRTAARFLQAGSAIELKDTAKAIKLYREIADDPEAPAVMRDLARLREVATGYDTMASKDVIARLRPLAEPGKPFFASAGELVAMAQLELGNTAEAGRLFAAIAKDEKAPDTLRSRARQMAGLLGVDAIVDVKKLLEDEGVDTSGSGGAEGSTDAAGNTAPPAQ